MNSQQIPSILLPHRSLFSKLKRQAAKRWYNRDHQYANIEGNTEYNFVLRVGQKLPGTSVMLRAKNEVDAIENCIRSIYSTFSEIVFVDNGSDDGTWAIVEDLKKEIDDSNKIRLYSYPFTVARCGSEHAETPESSLHSLVYYYNWCLSKLNHNYVVKWDADMYLVPEHRQRIGAYLEALQPYELRLRLPIQTVYIDKRRDVYLSDGEINVDNTIFPNRPYFRYIKGEHWEQFYTDFHLQPYNYPWADVYEIKDTCKDEFTHWSDTDFPTKRKQREWAQYNLIKAGQVSDGFTKIPIKF